MDLLLTSGGVSNPSIRAAMEDMLGKPVEDCTALCVPTAEHGHPACTPSSSWRFVAGRGEGPMVGLGWGSVGLLELTALESIGERRWRPWVEDADVLLVDGGDALYLAHWLRRSGLAGLLPSLDAVWVGMSAGSMVLTPRTGREFVGWPEPGGDDETLGLVGFSLFPHLGHPDMPANTLERAERWAAGLGVPAYAIDDQTAVRVRGEEVDVVSEGTWHALG